MRYSGFVEPAPGFPIWIGLGERGVSRLTIGEPLEAPEWIRDDAHPLVADAIRQVREYFEGKRSVFELPLELEGTRFQMRAWKALLDIPYGHTRTYGEQARALGSPGAARAVGGANHTNPVAIIVPCHRVVAASGLGGYGGGLDRKRFLLALERGKGA
jgi:methylated-DNA-[protein]-cysteine S-methyltransferase